MTRRKPSGVVVGKAEGNERWDADGCWWVTKT